MKIALGIVVAVLSIGAVIHAIGSAVMYERRLEVSYHECLNTGTFIEPDGGRAFVILGARVDRDTFNAWVNDYHPDGGVR